MSSGAREVLEGWLEKGGDSLFRGRQRRFYRLRGSTFAQHADPSAPEKSVLELWGARVDVNPRSKEIVITSPSDRKRLSLYAPTDDEFASWSRALMRATGTNLDAFYEVGRQIGSGAYGKVYEGRRRETGERVAIKSIEKSRASAKELRYIQRESDILTRVDHPNVVKTYDLFEQGEFYLFVMEFLAGGELFDMIAQAQHFSEEQAADVMRQLMAGITYLHANGIVHRDIKPENILCVSNSWPLHVKLTDFGLSNILDQSQLNSKEALVSYVGTPNYYAPEVFLHRKYGRPVDVFSAGVCLYIMVSGKFPFWGKTEEEYWERLRRGVRFPPKQWENVSDSLKDLLKSMLALDPDSRPPAELVTTHPWFQEHNSQSLGSELRSLHSSKRNQLWTSTPQ
mmetsp:Transcript_6928/g.12408  ORF Transcript_6928/g.12408 Transcript_6928/m.12408 type:complete len:397 (-) Transcript_6928:99-1289(-)